MGKNRLGNCKSITGELRCGLITLVGLALLFISSYGWSDALPNQSVKQLNQLGSISLASAVEFWIDNQDLTIESLLKQQGLHWQKNQSGRTNYGQSVYPYWFRIRISDLNAVRGKFFLRINYGNIDKVQAFYVADGAVIRQYQAGDTLPYDVRPVDERIPLFPLHQLGHRVVDIYLKAESEGPLEFPLGLITRQAYDQSERLTSLWLGAYFGIMIMMFLYNLLIYIVVREKAYLYYIAYVAITALLQFSLRCYGFKYIWPDSTTLNNQMILSLSALLPMVAIAFVKSFLKLNSVGGKWDVIIANIGIGIFSLLFFCSFFLSYMVVLKTTHMFAFVAVAFGFYLGVKYWFKGIKAARIFALAWFVYLVCVMFYLLEITGVWQIHPVMRYALEFGSVIELSLLSLAFGDRISEEKENISKLLKATKALSLASDKVSAARVALEHIDKICRNIQLENAAFYSREKHNGNMRQYTLWSHGKSVASRNGENTLKEQQTALKQIENITLKQHSLYIRVGTDKKVYGYLKIDKYHGDKSDIVLDTPLIESVIRSLVQTMETLEAEEKERLSMIGSMAAAIVHDLKNPIGAIQGCAELAMLTTATEKDRIKYLKTIISETQRMKTMAQEVLEYSRGDLVLNYQRVPAKAFANDVSASLQPMLETAGIAYQFDCHSDEELILDFDRIYRVVLNLATNAKDAMLQQGTEQPRVWISLAVENKKVIITVADNGPGIPESIRESLFEPFVTQGKAEGTGLGMAIVKKIVQAHQGVISFDSTSGKGTTFTIEIPQTNISITPSKESGTLKGLSVLLAEDNPVNQMVVSKYLEQRGVRVKAVFNGRQVLEALDNMDFDAVLMDVEMPEMDGIEATKKIKALPVGSTLTVIGLTGHSHEQELKQCHEAGMDAIVQKPVDKSLLETTLLRCVKQSKVSGF